MKDIPKLVYFLFKLFLCFFLFLPVFFLMGVLDILNKNNQFDEIISDLKSFLSWLMPGF